MADHEAAAWAPPVPLPVEVAPPPPTPRTAAAEALAALADIVVYGFLSAMFVGCAASIALIVARYTVGGGYLHAYAVVAAFARNVFGLALLAVEMLLPFTILVLVVRLARRQPEPPEELVVIEGVHVTVQIHGLLHPGARVGRQGQGTGYGLIPLLVFVVFSMFMLLVLLMQERWPAKECCDQTAADEAKIGDIASFICSVMVISVFIPHVLIQLRNMPR